jgi:hypothetical protein
MLELCNELAGLTWRIVIASGAAMVVAGAIGLRHLWRHHREWFGHKDGHG